MERTPANQAWYDLFLDKVVAAYGLRLDDGAKPSPGDSDNVVRVNAESASSYIEFIVSEHPYIPKRCEHFLRFSSKVSSRSVTKPHIRTVHEIARQYLGDCVYFWHEANDLSAYI